MVEHDDSEAQRTTRKKWPIVLGLIVLGVIIAIIVLVAVKPWQNQDTGMLPKSVIKNTNFTIYFYSEVIPGEFTIKDPAKDIQSSPEILLIRLTNEAGQSVVLSQQAVPSSLKGREVQGDEKVTGAPGSAAVSFQEGRTTGTLLAKKETMVVVNTADNVETDIMKDLLRGLTTVQ